MNPQSRKDPSSYRRLTTSHTSNLKSKLHNKSISSKGQCLMPHRGNLRRIDSTNPEQGGFMYSLSIDIGTNGKQFELVFSRVHYEHIHRLFCIIDTESRGILKKNQVSDFVALRCPVFIRRDEAIHRSLVGGDKKKLKEGNTLHVDPFELQNSTGERLQTANETDFEDPAVNRNVKGWNSTFDEVWDTALMIENQTEELSIEGWLLFCRLIALAQYQEAKSRFSAKHLQQNSEIIMVELPPLTPPAPLNLKALINHHYQNTAVLPLPELDLNHCLIAAHDNPIASLQQTPHNTSQKKIQIHVSLFGVTKDHPSNSLSTSPEPESIMHSGDMEFVVTTNTIDINNQIISTRVKRTLQDMEWLRDTFASHQTLGGTLCGRILPPFPLQEKGTGVKLLSSIKSLWGKRHKKWEGSEGIKKAKDLENCLNYFMEHPALRTSFPLNAILKASQSGLDAAKRLLQSHEENSVNVPPTTVDNSTSSISLLSSNNSHSKFFSSIDNGIDLSNFAWIRTAAQAAMALKLHGILDATGCASASSKLQHASLPSFDNSKWWRGDYNIGMNSTSHPSSLSTCDSKHLKNEDKEQKLCFEDGVVSIESELESDEAYDLLPTPATSDESSDDDVVPASSHIVPSQSNAKKFHYGTGENSVLTVDNDIHKLYDIIHSMDNTLSTCLRSSRSIGEHRRDRISLHIAIVKSLDSWIGPRGEIVGERFLMEGVEGLEDVRASVEDGEWFIGDALSWQSSLAASSVSAAETVRSAVSAARIAYSAKTAAESAALAAQKNCSGNFSSAEELRAAQTRASISHSHAINAAVIEHEAFGAKRRAAMALAHDVTCWNIHRRREMLKMLKQCARNQEETARKSRKAWGILRDGMYGVTPSFYDETRSEQQGELLVKDTDFTLDPVRGISCDNEYIDKRSVAERSNSGMAKIVPVDHKELKSPLESFPGLDSVLKSRSDTISPETVRSAISDNSDKHSSSVTTEENDVMTASMQSLVDGLMTWGGKFDAQDDLSLPSGMAVTIALEESGILGTADSRLDSKIEGSTLES